MTELSQSTALQWERGVPELSFELPGPETVPRPGWFESPWGTALKVRWVLRPVRVPAARRPLLILAGALAAWRVLDDLGLEPELVWPHEVRLGGRVVGGVRTQARGAGGPVVLGLGMYIALRPEAIPPEQRDRITSLAIAGSDADRLEVLLRYRRHLQALYEALQRDPEEMLVPYRAACATLGRTVRVTDRSDVEGLAVGIDADGHLVLDTGEHLTELVSVVDPPSAGRRVAGRSARRVGLSVLGVSFVSASGVVCTRRLRRRAVSTRR